jgi:hypothetical protein
MKTAASLRSSEKWGILGQELLHIYQAGLAKTQKIVSWRKREN